MIHWTGIDVVHLRVWDPLLLFVQGQAIVSYFWREHDGGWTKPRTPRQQGYFTVQGMGFWCGAFHKAFVTGTRKLHFSKARDFNYRLVDDQPNL